MISGKAVSSFSVSRPVESSINTEPVRAQKSRQSCNSRPDPACITIDGDVVVMDGCQGEISTQGME
ncbi:hypothetical protein D3C73_783960 [compost metagenome]